MEAGSGRSTSGAGSQALLMALLQAEDRAERENKRKERQADREESEAEERAVAEWFDDVQAVADAAMAEAGFHKHRGQWRRKRK